MLPEGFCPKITNTMVRRERAIRRLRGHIDIQDTDQGPESQTWWMAATSRIFRAKSDPSSSTSTELQEAQPRATRSQPQPVQLPLRPGHHDGDAEPPGIPTALARERMRELAGFEPDYGEGGQTRCKSMSEACR
jgi:hypothetical protein